MFSLILFLVSITLAQYTPLPDCQAISPNGWFFDWTPLGAYNMTLRTYYFIANVCGINVYPCESGCGFCDARSRICDGYNLPQVGYHGVWNANTPSTGTATFYRSGSATINLICDYNAKTPIISGGENSNYPYVLTLTSDKVCPIGQCPNGCSYSQGWGSCHPSFGFSCTCNVGFMGKDCSVSNINSNFTITTGTFKNGFTAGGQVWIAFQIYDNKKNIVPCTAKLFINQTFSSYMIGCNEKTGERNYTMSGTKAGVYELAVTLFNLPVRGSPFVYIISPAFPDYKFAKPSGKGLYSATVYQNNTFYIQLADQYQNNVTSCPFGISSEYSGQLYGVGFTQVSFSCNLGVLTGTYTVYNVGYYQLKVLYKRDLAPGFPVQINAI